jgi:uncharacterized protein with von Willebrand factor type A (vWA) domain
MMTKKDKLRREMLMLEMKALEFALQNLTDDDEDKIGEINGDIFDKSIELDHLRGTTG